ncbi:MAG: type II toxin-antitoxin system RelE/ParE family toxin [Nitrospira sp.]|nr:type II toxin-antitoxin system RelE/ParE family toxin [Nitrospira sp.]
MIRLEWTDPAVADLENIQAYVARDSPEYAQALIDRLIMSVEQLAPFPTSGRRVPEASDPRIRELLVEGYCLIYRVRRGNIQVLAVVHGARSLSRIKPRPWAGR